MKDIDVLKQTTGIASLRLFVFISFIIITIFSFFIYIYGRGVGFFCYK